MVEIGNELDDLTWYWSSNWGVYEDAALILGENRLGNRDHHQLIIKRKREACLSRLKKLDEIKAKLLNAQKAMLQIDIRHGTEEDTLLITDLVKNMVAEMTLYGGQLINDAPEVWSSMAEQVKVNITHPEYIYLIAGSGTSKQTTVGIAVGNIEQLESIFVTKSRLHISAIYTVPAARGQGIARQLIRRVLELGQRMNVSEVDLNVLAANPARFLYEHLGFQVYEISMVKKLNGDQFAST